MDEGFSSLFTVSDYSSPCNLLSLTYLKSGELRTTEDTHNTIVEQIRLSTVSGGTDKVKKAITATGVHDAGSAQAVEILLQMGKELRRRDTGRKPMSEAEIQKLLEEELAKQLEKNPINPLIGITGAAHHNCASHLILIVSCSRC